MAVLCKTEIMDIMDEIRYMQMGGSINMYICTVQVKSLDTLSHSSERKGVSKLLTNTVCAYVCLFGLYTYIRMYTNIFYVFLQ